MTRNTRPAAGVDAIRYCTKTAGAPDLYRHLLSCNREFQRRLTERVNLWDYATKLSDRSLTFECWDAGLLIGVVAAYFNDEKSRSAYITNVSTTLGFEGRGIASALLAACLRYAREHAVAEIRLEVFKDNTRAIHLYRRMGFFEDEDKNPLVVMKCSMKDCSEPALSQIPRKPDDVPDCSVCSSSPPHPQSGGHRRTLSPSLDH